MEFHTLVRNTEKSSPQATYFTLIERRVFSWLGKSLSVSSLRPSWPKQFLPQPYTAPATGKEIWKGCAKVCLHLKISSSIANINLLLNKNYHFLVTLQANFNVYRSFYGLIFTNDRSLSTRKYNMNGKVRKYMQCKSQQNYLNYLLF